MADEPSFPDKIRDFFSTVDRRIALGMFALLAVYYGVMTPVEFTVGDGPELVLAAYTLGNPHPSGYPLFSILGFFASNAPGPSEYWNTSFFLSALTTAGAATFLFLTLRRLAIGVTAASLAAFAWAFASPIVYQATRVEVYGLHCLFVGAALWAGVTMLKVQRPERDEEPTPNGTPFFWASLTVAFVCLGLTNHLTSVFLVVPVVLAIALADHKMLLSPKNIAIFAAIAAAGAAVYAYLPLTAMANTGDRLSWNDPQTLDNFLHHVTGAEYAKHRNFNNLGPSLMKFLRRFDAAFFPGIAVLSGLGLYEIASRRWRAFIPLALIAGSMLIYVGSYQINDIATYDPPIYFIFLVAAGAAVDWLLQVRFKENEWEPFAKQAALVAVAAIVILSGWRSRTNQWKELLGHDHSTTVWEAVEKPAIIFSDLDRHTFPLWYQAMVLRPEDDVVAFDSVMLTHPEMKWYRAFLMKRYPNFKFPTDEVIKKENWRDWMIRNNPEHNPYVILAQPWRGRATHAVLRGPYHQVFDGRPDKPVGKLERKTSMLFMANYKRAHGNTYWTNMKSTFKLGEPIACVTEWMDHDGIDPTWKLVGPDGAEVTYKKHPVPKGSNLSWEYFPQDQQKVGTWECQVFLSNDDKISIEFEIVE